MEEAGVVIAVERLVAVNERLPDPHAVFFVFRARIVDGTPTVTDDEETDRFKWVDPEEANDLLSHWGMDFCLHDDYGALYHTGQWEDRDWCCRSTRHQSGILDGPSEPVFDWPLSCPVQLIRKSPRECKD
jgi:hypothetical protein